MCSSGWCCALVHACTSIPSQQSNSSNPPHRTSFKPLVHFSRSIIILRQTQTLAHSCTEWDQNLFQHAHTPSVTFLIKSSHCAALHISFSPLTRSPPAETSHSHFFSMNPQTSVFYKLPCLLYSLLHWGFWALKRNSISIQSGYFIYCCEYNSLWLK